jgi:Ca-activated chloride channel homolog
MTKLTRSLTFLSTSAVFALATACGSSDSDTMEASFSGEGDNQTSGGSGGGAGVGTGPGPDGSGGNSNGDANWGGSGGSSAGGAGNSAGAAGAGAGTAAGGGSNVSLSGSQDFGYFRRQLADGQVPVPGTFDASGFFAEHHTALPPPSCGERLCIQPMMGVMGNLTNGEPCTMLQLGLKTPLDGDPGERPPLTLSVVVDSSGSMSGEKMDFVKSGLEQLIDSLHDEDQFSLIEFNNEASTVFPMQGVQSHRAEARDLIATLQAGGGTNVYDGLVEGYASVSDAYDSGRQNRVILLSDGLATSGNTSSEAIIDMSRAQNSDGIGLTTIGLGTGFDAELMRSLALQADGNYYFLEDSAAVEEVFREEINYFTVPIAFDLSIALHAGEDYSLGAAYGSPFWEGDSTGGLIEVPSAFIAHRESHEAPTGRRGGGSALLFELMANSSSGPQTTGDVATVDFSFREPGTNRTVEDQINITYPYAPWDIPMSGYFDADDPAVIQKSFVMLNIFVGLEQACTTFHENGDVEDAIRGLQRLRAAVVDYNNGSNDLDGDGDDPQDDDIRADVELIDSLIAVLRSRGFDPGVDPAPEEDPWPAD